MIKLAIKLIEKLKYSLSHLTLIGLYILILKVITPMNVIAALMLILGLVSISLGTMETHKMIKAVR